VGWQEWKRGRCLFVPGLRIGAGEEKPSELGGSRGEGVVGTELK